MTIDTRPVVGLMLGDVTGIGAEIVAKMLATQDVKGLARTVLVGDPRHLALGCRDAGTEVAFHGVTSIEAIDWSRSGFPLLDLGNLDPAKFPRAQVSPEAGRVAGETQKAMTDLAWAESSTPCASRRSTSRRCTAAAGTTTTSTRCSPTGPGTAATTAR